MRQRPQVCRLIQWAVILALGGSSLLFGSCHRDHDCLNPPIVLVFQGFDSMERADLVFREFEKGTSYTVLDKEQIIPQWLGPFNEMITGEHDYEFEFQGVAKKYRLYDVHFEREMQTLGLFETLRENCSNTVVWTLNGVAQSSRGRAGGNTPGQVGIPIPK